jgi:hypothetical protein
MVKNLDASRHAAIVRRVRRIGANRTKFAPDQAAGVVCHEVGVADFAPTLEPPSPNGSMYMQPSNHELFVERAENAFGAVYLTLISIVQGVALGYLAQTISDRYESLSLDEAGRVVATFLLFLTVWQEYMVKASAFSWVPTILDTLVPFILGAVEFLMVASTSKPLTHYLLLVSIFYGLGAIGCLNYYFQATRSQSKMSQDARRVISVHFRTQYLIATGCFLYSTGIWIAAMMAGPFGQSWLPGWLSIVPALVFALSIIPRWNRPILMARRSQHSS